MPDSETSGSEPTPPDGRSPRRRAGQKRNGQQSAAGKKNNGRGPSPAFAALDLGTNNCRLLVARDAGKNFRIIDSYSRVVRLGQGLASTGRLADDSMDAAVEAIGICARKMKSRRVKRWRCVATEACRKASNGDEFLARVKSETGISLEVISPRVESRLAVMGCLNLVDPTKDVALVIDIGGGSTELVLLEPGEKIPRIIDWQSVPWGVVSLTDTIAKVGVSADTDGAPSRDARLARYAKMREVVSESFAPFAKRIAEAAGHEDIRLLGTSGTVTTLASLHLQLPHYDRKAVDGLIVPSDAMRAISTELSGMSPVERSEVPCIGHDRADLVVAGCAILESILDLWPAERLGVADRGIREGILRSLMAAERQSERSLKALHDMREEKA